ncbi:PREDICTED: receptor expression-enhancing protein 6 isoform X1 [Condylura cristata]|uniref:receptor expression-enhancing protein 6 isoform X1 n=1 Tax=Condylura cristata TaxID=143302 RepID=UPI000643AAC3|nr:PREDICTED: receptor expression-enhancing protein 6 isoform X1 [Condylura cristata]
MRRGRRGRPHLLCPPCPPIGPSGGPGAETIPGAERGGSRPRKAVRARLGRCAGPRSSSRYQSQSRRCHGRSATALRTISRTEELGHRRPRSARSQDRCRQAVPGRGSRHSAKPVSSVRLRGVSAVQSHRLCIPRICLNQSYRESKQRGRHCVAHLLGGVRSVRPGRVLQRSTPVLVPFLLRGQASRGSGQRRERIQRASAGHGGRNNQGRQNKPDPAPEGQVKALPSSSPNLQTGKDTLRHRSPADSSPESPAEPTTSPVSPSKSGPKSSSQTDSLGASQSSSPSSGTASSAQLPGKSQAQSRARGSSVSQPQGPSQQCPRPLSASAELAQPTAQPAGSVPRPSPNSSQDPASMPPPNGTTVSGKPSSNTSDKSEAKPPRTPAGPGAPKTKSGAQHHKQPAGRALSSSSVPELPVSCPSESSVEFTSESATEVTCSWPHHRHGLHYLQQCWRLKHLAC